MHLLFIYDLPKKNEMPHWYRLSDKCFLSSVSVGCVFVKFAHFDTMFRRLVPSQWHTEATKG